ncbi:hypothetical protein H8959_018979 [Pygathrix nigripes]
MVQGCRMVTRTKKIFVGGLSANTVVEDVKQYFEQFGKDFGDQKEAFKLNEFSASSRMERFRTFQLFPAMIEQLSAELASIKTTIQFCVIFDGMYLEFHPATPLLPVCGTHLLVALALMKELNRCGPKESSSGWILW